MTSSSPIVRFYSGIGRDKTGRKLSTILQFSNDELEHTHDYIQWLFPLEETSASNPDAPLVDKKSRDQFRMGPQLQANVCKACRRMLAFYGIVCTSTKETDGQMIVSKDFPERVHNWLSPNNHNHLRLTRIMKSLRLLGFEKCSEMLYQRLKKIAVRYPGSVTAITLEYWRESQVK